MSAGTATPLSTARDTCVLCGKGRYAEAAEVARIPSNVRRWRTHLSTVWRCGVCGSLHSLERIDLDPFYQDYPFAQRRLDGFTRGVYAHYLRRLRRQGLRPDQAVLDYGCSGGLLLDYLRECGYRQVQGFDPYHPDYRDAAVLARQYDVVICQDVIEHVEDPIGLLQTLAGLLRPGGFLCLGTPRAEGIDLGRAREHLHSLHQPYHLHILSERALGALARHGGLELERVWRRHSCDTPYPFVNWPFLRAYLAALDDTLDAGFEPPRPEVVARSPRLWLLGLMGYLLPSPAEMIAILRRRAGAGDGVR